MTQQQNGDFSPINLKSFIIDTKINFDLYMLHPSQNRHVLFSSKNTQFSDATRKILLDNKVPSLYISPCDYDLYLQYIEKYLNRIISNTTIATPQKSEWIFECAKKITHDTLDNPDVRKNIRRSTTFVKNLVGFITKERSYFPHVQKLFETDYSLSCHSINVCMYALALCVAMGESSLKILEGVGMGCLLHDIGMTVIPHDILHKDGALDELERETIQKHPEFSTQLLNNLSVKNELIYDIAKSHHEKLDGSGYPIGLKGDDIPSHTRIVAIADIFDALTSQRPHRDAFPTYQAFKILINDFEGKVDGDILKKFVTLFQNKK